MEDEINSRKYIICQYKSQVPAVAVSLFLVAFFSIPVVIYSLSTEVPPPLMFFS